ncbi:unnamed protein product [Brassica rapa subsp. narinosa]
MPEKVENVEANDVATERSSKRMRVRTQESALYISDLFFFPSRFREKKKLGIGRQENECGKLLL